MECKKCGCVWKNIKEKPKVCPSCHRYNYDVPRRYKTERIEQPINIAPEKKPEEEKKVTNKDEVKLSW